MSTRYDGKQYVGIDLHRRRSVLVRQAEAGERLGWVRIDNELVALSLEIEKSGPGSGGGARGHLRLVLGS